MKKGDRVELLPHTDQWMQGDRYGTIKKSIPMDRLKLFWIKV